MIEILSPVGKVIIDTSRPSAIIAMAAHQTAALYYLVEKRLTLSKRSAWSNTPNFCSRRFHGCHSRHQHGWPLRRTSRADRLLLSRHHAANASASNIDCDRAAKWGHSGAADCDL